MGGGEPDRPDAAGAGRGGPSPYAHSAADAPPPDAGQPGSARFAADLGRLAVPARRVHAALRSRFGRPGAIAIEIAVPLLLIVIAVVLIGSSSGERAYAPALADPVPYDGRSPREPTGREQRVLVSLPRPALGALKGVRTMSPEAQRDYVASLKREAVALRSALDARGVEFRDVVSYERTWNGFAATVRTEDLAAVGSLGVRPQPVRRFYPATGQPVPVRAGRPATAEPASGGRPVALLDSGVDPDHPLLRGRLVDGYDAVGRDRDPRPGADPRDRRRREVAGTALAGVLAAAGERVMPIRVAALRAGAGGGTPEEVASTDRLLAGLERAVDPNGDASTDDHVRVAVVGVNAPYAGFDNSPEAQAIRGAAGLGTLVVAPAGNEGAAHGASSTIGSPGAATNALTAGALADRGAVPRVELRAGDIRVRGAAVLAGAPPSDRDLRTAGPVDATDPARLLARGAPRLTGRLALVRVGDNPAGQAAAAAAAGARAVLLVEPRPGRILPAMPAGRVAVPVLGVTGDAAEAVLDAGADEAIRLGKVEPGPSTAGAGGGASAGGGGKEPKRPGSGGSGSEGSEPGGPDSEGSGPGGSGSDESGSERSGSDRSESNGSGRLEPPRLAPFTSRGPILAGALKPDLAAPGAATTALVRGGYAVAGGTGVAAARVGAAAARLARERPQDGPAQLRAALVRAAEPVATVPVAGGGAGVLRSPPSKDSALRAEAPRVPPPQPAGGFVANVIVGLRNDGDAPLRVSLATPADPGVTAKPTPATAVIPPHGRQEVTIAVSARARPEGGFALGRLVAKDDRGNALLTVRWHIPAGEPQAVPLGDLQLTKEKDRVTGVRFTLGAFDRGDPIGSGTSIAAAERLDLELLDANGNVKRRLTPPGGAPELLPAEYAYTLPRSMLSTLDKGTYVFRAIARGPRQPRDTERRSAPFQRP